MFHLAFVFLLLLSILPEYPCILQVPEINFLKCNPSMDAFCEIENLCLSREHGIFGVTKDPSTANFPTIHTSPYRSYNDMAVKVKAVSVHDIHTEVAFFENTHLSIIGTYMRNQLMHQMVGTAMFLYNLTQHHGLHCKSRHLLALEIVRRNFAVPMDFLGYSDILHGRPLFNKSANFAITDERGEDILKNLAYCYSYATLGTNKPCGSCTPALFTPATHEHFRDTVLKFYHIPKPSKPRRDHAVICERQGRSILNQNQMIDTLREFGLQVQVINFSSVDFKDQLQSVANAAYYFAPYGNGNSPILWLPPGAAFFEFFGPRKLGGIGCSALAKSKSLIYIRMDCTSPECSQIPPSEDAKTENMIADILTLKAKVEEVRKQINLDSFFQTIYERSSDDFMDSISIAAPVDF